MMLSLGGEKINKEEDKKEEEMMMRTKIRGAEYCFFYRGDSLLVVNGNNATVKIGKI